MFDYPFLKSKATIVKNKRELSIQPLTSDKDGMERAASSGE